jgi:hypothetical protein
VDIIGMSILGIPNAAQSQTGTKDISYNRVWATMKLLREGLYDPTVWYHYLGAGSPSEVRLQRLLGMMTSMDTSSPIWHGINGIQYDESATGLVGGKIKKHVDFNLERCDSTSVEFRKMYDIVLANIQYIKDSLK